MAFEHRGWMVQRSLSALRAHVSWDYVAIVELVDDRVMQQEFHHELLDQEVIWSLFRKPSVSARRSWARSMNSASSFPKRKDDDSKGSCCTSNFASGLSKEENGRISGRSFRGLWTIGIGEATRLRTWWRTWCCTMRNLVTSLFGKW